MHDITDMKIRPSVAEDALPDAPEKRQEPYKEIPPAIGPEQLPEFTRTLQKYKSGKAHLERRVISSEQWWKLRNAQEQFAQYGVGGADGFKSVSGWLHNVIVSKHADAMEAYPEPVILPREESDKAQAQILSNILPLIMEQNNFEETYSNAMWRKGKTGTGIYKVVWDSGKLNGLGDISISSVSELNLYWEPGITDIQRSRYVFQTELMDDDLLIQKYPQLEGKLGGSPVISSKFLYDDAVPTDGKSTVIDVYYKTYRGGKTILHYLKYIDDTILYSTENENPDAGLYDHGLYPYVFDALFPVEGSPCGYGYIDLCRNPQTEIDLIKTAFVKNTMAGATPRYFERMDGAVNEKEFLDLSKAIVHVNGNLGEDSVRQIQFSALDSVYLGVLDRTISELRETSGNTETANGISNSGVTAASAIAALQEASGKGSRDSTKSSYRAFGNVINLCVELIRQFYDMPRQFRIVGETGREHFLSYTNAGLRPQEQGSDFGVEMGLRRPVFDIKISAQKKSVYTRVSQNELALQFFQLGFFNPQVTDQALMCLEMMDFDGKEGVVRKVVQNSTAQEKLAQYQQLALTFAQMYRPDMAQGLAQDMTGQLPGSPTAALSASAPESSGGEDRRMRSSRERSLEAAQPRGGRVIGERGD